MNKLILIPTIVFTLLFLLASCNQFAPHVDSKTIAKVNGVKISLEEFTLHYEQLRSEQDEISRKNPKLNDQLKVRALNEAIISTLLTKEGQKLRIQVAKEEVEGRLANWRDSYPAGGFEAMLKKQSTSMKFIKQRIAHLLLIEKLAGELFSSETLVSDEEMKKYFKKHRKDFYRPERVHALHILVPTVEEAQKVRQEIATNKITFESAARKYSLSPDSSRGGDIGFFSRNMKIPTFNQAFTLKVGMISKPLQSTYGVHLLKVIEKQVRKRLTYQEAQSTIARRLKRDKEAKVYKEWVTKLLKEGKIYRNETLYASL